jgi:hypothetical protein
MSKRKDIARDLLQKGYVTNAEFAAAGAIHTCRNAISELKAEYAAQGLVIIFTAGETFLENRWTLVPAPPTEIKTLASETAKS